MARVTSLLFAALLACHSVIPTAAQAQDWEMVNVGDLDVGNYTDVWGASLKSVFITGTSGILHFNGSTWSEMTLPSGITCCNAIWGIDGSNIYAAGNGVLLRYDGSSWREVNIGDHQSTLESTDLIDVWAGQGGGEDRVVVLGNQGRYFVKTANSWTKGGVSSYPNVSVRGDSASYLRTYWFPSQVLGDPYSYRGWYFADGQWRFIDRSQRPGAVFHYGWPMGLGGDAYRIIGVGNNITASYDENGDETIIDSPVSWDSSFRFRDLTGTPGSIYAVGHNGFYGSVLKFDGAGWTNMAPSGSTLFGDIWGSSDTDLWALTPDTIWHYGMSASAPDAYLGVEIIQTITEPDRLTQGKPINVRAYVLCSTCTPVSGNATVALTFDGFQHQESMAIAVEAGLTMADLHFRKELSFNFTIPASEFEFSEGSIQKTLDLTLNGTLDGQFVQDTWSRTLTFEYLRPLRVGLGWITLVSSELPEITSPTFQDESLTIEHVRAVYPGEVEVRYVGNLFFDVDAAGEPATCDAACLEVKIRDEVTDWFLRGVSDSPIFQGLDYMHGLLPVVSGPERLQMGGASDPYWSWDFATGYGSVGARQFLSHEVGHNLGLHHTAWRWDLDSNGEPALFGACPNEDESMQRDLPGDELYAYAWPHTDAYIDTWGWGQDPADSVKSPFLHFDFMSYCGQGPEGVLTVWETDEWVSRVHYDRMIANLAAPPPIGRSKTGHPMQPIGLLPAEHRLHVNVVSETYSMVRIDLNADDTVDLIRAETITNNIVYPRGADTGTYCVALERMGTPLDRQCFEIDFVDEDRRPVADQMLLVHFPFDATATDITLKKDDVLLAMLPRSASAPEVSIVSVTPQGSNVFEACWDSFDLDGDPLSFTVYYGPDDGSQWLPVALSQLGPCATLELDGLPSSGFGRIRVTATDGFDTAEATSAGTIFVADAGPRIHLGHAELVTSIGAGGQFVLSATAVDAEDGPLASSAMVWREQGGAIVGHGSTLVTLTSAVQTYTVTATDSVSNTATRTVTLSAGGIPPIFADGFEGVATSE